MKEHRDIFTDEIRIPDVVLRKADDAFARIQKEGNLEMNRKKEQKKKKRKNFLRRQTAAAACICLLVAAGITATAAIHRLWSRGMQGTVRATQTQQQELIEQGVATVLEETESPENLSVTDGTVTITPQTVIVDSHFAHISFLVEGYAPDGNVEPAFEFTKAWLGEDPDAENAQASINASFYNGIVSDENGDPVYEDGTALESDGDGRLISRYQDESGRLEYIVSVHSSDPQSSLSGQTLHVSLSNLGTVSKAEYIPAQEGNWEFAIPLSDSDSTVSFPADSPIDGTGFVLKSVDLSPISATIRYDADPPGEIREDETGIPHFMGVVLEDGTRLPYLADGGSGGYTDETMTSACTMSGFDRVIDPRAVTSVLILTEAGTDMQEVPLRRESVSE